MKSLIADVEILSDSSTRLKLSSDRLLVAILRSVVRDPLSHWWELAILVKILTMSRFIDLSNRDLNVLNWCAVWLILVLSCMKSSAVWNTTSICGLEIWGIPSESALNTPYSTRVVFLLSYKTVCVHGKLVAAHDQGAVSASQNSHFSWWSVMISRSEVIQWSTSACAISLFCVLNKSSGSTKEISLIVLMRL